MTKRVQGMKVAKKKVVRNIRSVSVRHRRGKFTRVDGGESNLFRDSSFIRVACRRPVFRYSRRKPIAEGRGMEKTGVLEKDVDAYEQWFLDHSLAYVSKLKAVQALLPKG